MVKFKAKRTVPVVAVTAYTDDSTKEKAKKFGMSDLLHKPVSHETLEGVLNKFFYN